jgi:hypothetical protein
LPQLQRLGASAVTLRAVTREQQLRNGLFENKGKTPRILFFLSAFISIFV